MSRFTIHDLAATIDVAPRRGEASYTRKMLDKARSIAPRSLARRRCETVIAAVEK